MLTHMCSVDVGAVGPGDRDVVFIMTARHAAAYAAAFDPNVLSHIAKNGYICVLS